MDLGHWFEACWMPDCSADFATASQIIDLLESLGNQRDYLNIEIRTER